MRLDKQQQLATGDVTLLMYKIDEAGNEVPLKEETFRNLIVKKASVLMARRMAPGTNSYTAGGFGNHISSGFQYLALGTHPGTGTPQAPEPSSESMERLRGELMRKPITSWRFVEANILELTTEIAEAEAVGALTEMGLFGGDATAAANSGYMFNHKAFPVWNKPNDARLKIIWKITF